MKPLQAVGMGLVIVALGAKVAGFDFSSPTRSAGCWSCTASGGCHRLPWSSTVTALCTIRPRRVRRAVVPGHCQGARRPDASWNGRPRRPPKIVAVAALCAALAPARAGGRRPARYAWLRTALPLLVLTAVVPVIRALRSGGAVAGISSLDLVTIVVVIVLVAYSSRPWAAPPTDRRLDQTTVLRRGG